MIRRSKYGAAAVAVDGIRFDSKAEAKRYGQLKQLQIDGKIRNLELQPRYQLWAWDGSMSRPVAVYVADFTYEERGPSGTWLKVTEDVKGFETEVYALKARWFHACYGREVRETGRRRGAVGAGSVASKAESSA